MRKYAGSLGLVMAGIFWICQTSLSQTEAVLCGHLGGTWTCSGQYPWSWFGLSGCELQGQCNNGVCNEMFVLRDVEDIFAQFVAHDTRTGPEEGTENYQLSGSVVVCPWMVFCNWECELVNGISKCQDSPVSIPFGSFDYSIIGSCPR